jgi:hypothetical protein
MMMLEIATATKMVMPMAPARYVECGADTKRR